MCILEPKYQECIDLLLPGECIYISSVADIKDLIKSWNLEKKTPEEVFANGKDYVYKDLVSVKESYVEECLEWVTNFESKFENAERIWTCIGDNAELVKSLFTDKLIFNLPIASIKKTDNSNEYVTIAKQLLPLVTEKNIESVFIDIEHSEYDMLYEVLIDFRFTHFRLEGLYNVLPIPFK